MCFGVSPGTMEKTMIRRTLAVAAMLLADSLSTVGGPVVVNESIAPNEVP